MLKKFLLTSKIYMILGLVAGIYYREFTRWQGFTGESQLSVVHTHALVLGMVFFLLVLSLEKHFNLSSHKRFKHFYLSYNLGLVWLLVMMLIRGTLTVLGYGPSPVLAGISGLGHIIITFGLVWFFKVLKDQVAINE